MRSLSNEQLINRYTRMKKAKARKIVENPKKMIAEKSLEKIYFLIEHIRSQQSQSVFFKILLMSVSPIIS
jgi:hypothetical protein